MKVHIYPEEDGTVTIFVKRTLRGENPSRAVQGVRPEDIATVSERLINEMSPPKASSTP